MSQDLNITEALLGRARDGSDAAIDELLLLYRARLRQLFAVRVGDWMRGRVDPSDLVQETLTEAAQKLEKFLVDRPIAFYPWLRQIGIQRLSKAREFHLAQKRNAMRERHGVDLSGESVQHLVDRLGANLPSPSAIARQAEQSDQMRKIIAQLSESDRELLVLRYLEQLPVDECLTVLRVSREAYKKRHFRAIKRLRELLTESEWEL